METNVLAVSPIKAGEMLGISSRTVYRLVESGDLVSVSLYPSGRGRRITVQSIHDYMSKKEVKK